MRNTKKLVAVLLLAVMVISGMGLQSKVAEAAFILDDFLLGWGLSTILGEGINAAKRGSNNNSSSGGNIRVSTEALNFFTKIDNHGQVVEQTTLWLGFIPKADTVVPKGMIAINQRGQLVGDMVAGEPYRITLEAAYANHFPKDRENFLTELLFLGTPAPKSSPLFTSIDENGVVLEKGLPFAYSIPEPTDGTRVVVHYGSNKPRNPGFVIPANQKFTCWVEPDVVVNKDSGEVVTSAPAQRKKMTWDELVAAYGLDESGKEVSSAPTTTPVEPAQVSIFGTQKTETPAIKTEVVETTVFPNQEHTVVTTSAAVPASAPAVVQTVVPTAAPQVAAVQTEKISKLWHRARVHSSTTVPAGQIYFDKFQTKYVSGVTISAGDYYYIIAQDFERFVPANWQDFGELQYPGTPLQKLGSTGANGVIPAHTWYKPANSGRKYVVHYNQGADSPAGTQVDGPFTGWVN